jgi:hypothetical protein
VRWFRNSDIERQTGQTAQANRPDRAGLRTAHFWDQGTAVENRPDRNLLKIPIIPASFGHDALSNLNFHKVQRAR